jgi:hypothetical protein
MVDFLVVFHGHPGTLAEIVPTARTARDKAANAVEFNGLATGWRRMPAQRYRRPALMTAFFGAALGGFGTESFGGSGQRIFLKRMSP